MSEQRSFTKYENQILPTFRKRINDAESTEDVRKFFAYTVGDLFEKVFSGRVSLEYGDVALDAAATPPYALSARLRDVEAFSSVYGASDLPNVLTRLAETAAHRLRHLEKNPQKTNAKIRN